MSDNNDKPKKKKGSLADQLSRLEFDLPKDSEKAPESRPQPKPEPKPEPPPEKELSPEELFRQAVENIDEKKIYSAKYQGEAAAPLPERPDTDEAQRGGEKEPGSRDDVDEEDARKKVLESRDAALFEQMVGAVNPLTDREKYKAPHGPHRAPEIDKEEEKETLADGLITPSLPREGEGLNYVEPLTLSQRALMKRYQRHAISERVPKLNIRGDTLEDGMRQLELFMHQSWKEDEGFVEIIHGRGLQSEVEPVLKPAVLEWLETRGLRYIRGYVPRRNSAGDYGSLIVELTPPSKTTSKKG